MRRFKAKVRWTTRIHSFVSELKRKPRFRIGSNETRSWRRPEVNPGSPLRVDVERVERLAGGHEQPAGLGPPKHTLAATSGRWMRPISLACGFQTVTPLYPTARPALLEHH